MTNPVTSTMVATKGADEVAGSAPIFFSSSGNIEPDSVPYKTIPNKVMATVIPNNNQCGP